MTSDDASGEFLPPARFSAVQLLILLLCFCAAMIDGFDILVIAYTAPAIIHEWGLPPGQMGVIFSAGLLGMTLGSMFLGAAADVFGRRIVCSASLLLAGLGTAGVHGAGGVEQLVALRFVSGLGLGTLLSALPTLTREFSPARQRNLTVALLMAGTSVGGVVGGMLTASLAAQFGWRAIFLWAGVLTMVIGALFQLVVPESMPFIAGRGRSRSGDALPRINRILRYLGHPQLSSLPAAAAAQAQESASVMSLLTPARRLNTLLAWAAFFFSYATIYFLSSWLPKMLVDAGLSQQQGIQGTVVLTAGAIAGTVLVAGLSRRWRLNLLITLAFGLGTALMGAFSLFIHEVRGMPPGVLWSLIFLIGLLLSGAFANLYSVSLALYPAQVRSTGLGWCIGLGRGGAVASPVIAGMLIGAGMSASTMLQVFALPMVVAAACVASIRLREPRT
ncbi:MFS transporter [Pelomonas sp. KK5]|uniref:MFS transporter n=1 Tax=Pelomonas sp. KK5 TaxID=1855730 RepID=UPI00097C292A|nr:MFS transporter [Pelomonas sp. KK5]